MRRVHTDRRIASRQSGDREKGIVLPLVAIMLVLLVAFAAFAVDVGLLYSERRQEQDAVDAAALAAVQDTQTDEGEIANTVFAVVNASSKTQYTAADWNDSAVPGTKCPPAEIPVGFTPLGPVTGTVSVITDTNCIALQGSGNTFKVWVRIPTTEVDAQFAAVVGIDSFESSAYAIAGFGHDTSKTNVLPFPLSSMGGESGHFCMAELPAGLASFECDDGPTSGVFRTVEITRPSSTSNQRCNGAHNDTIATNIADGMDHQLAVYPWADYPNTASSAALEENTANCSSGAILSGSMLPNNFDNVSGAAIKDGIEQGFILGLTYGGVSYAGRLTDTPFTTRPIKGLNLDDEPLWYFLTPGMSYGGDPDANDAPLSCEVATITADMTSPAPTLAMGACLAEYDAEDYGTTGVPLFGRDDMSPGDGFYDIQDSPRFGFVPEAWEVLWDRDGTYDEWGVDGVVDNDGLCDTPQDPVFDTGDPDFLVPSGPSSGPTKCRFNLKRMRAVFVQSTIYQGGSDNGCVWSPGEGGPASDEFDGPCDSATMSGSANFRGFTAFVFDANDGDHVHTQLPGSATDWTVPPFVYNPALIR